jgi:DNA transposition AAA+ family ATPase
VSTQVSTAAAVPTREEAREALRLYQMRTGLSVGQIALRMGYARRSLIQYATRARYGDGNGAETARRIIDFIRANPPEAPEFPGTKLYDTENVRMIDREIVNAQRGHFTLVYGPAGTQKSFVFEWRTAEAWREALEPGVVYIYADPDMTPLALLQEIAFGLGADVGISRHAALRAILYTLRRRKSPVAIVIDEAQNLAKRFDTLETLRQVCDRGRIGLLIAGHDNVEDIFRPRGDGQLAQWRSRVQQHRRCLPGLSPSEAREIIQGEIGAVPEKVRETLIGGSMEHDTRKRKDYISARRLFNALRDFNDKKEGKIN